MLGDACQEDLAALKIDEEQHIEPAESNGIDAEKVAGERAGRLSSKKLSPRRSRLSRSRYEPVSSKHVANARGRDHDPELFQLADDAEIAPPRILPRETKDERDDLSIERVERDLLATRVRPVPANELTVPAHQRRRRDEEGGPTLARKKTRECRQHGTMSGGEPRTRHLATKDRDLMT
jgi:hypothetical protein